jgi:hypothetical protein
MIDETQFAVAVRALTTEMNTFGINKGRIAATEIAIRVMLAFATGGLD